MKPWIRFCSFFSILISLFLLGSCGDSQQTSAPMINISIDPSLVEYDQAATVYTFFENIAKSSASNVDVADVISLVSLLDQNIGATVESAVAGKYPQGMDVTCNQNKCYGIAEGTATNIILEDVDIGGMINPELILADTLEVKFQLLAPRTLEVCSIVGAKVKTGVTSNLDGAFLKLSTDLIEEMTVDVGILGSYPSKKCNI